MTRFPAKVPEGFTPDANPLGKRRVFNTGVIAAQPDAGRQFVSALRFHDARRAHWVRFAIFKFQHPPQSLRPKPQMYVSRVRRVEKRYIRWPYLRTLLAYTIAGAGSMPWWQQ